MFWKRVKAFFTGKPDLAVEFDRWYWSFGPQFVIDWAPGFHFDGLYFYLDFGPLHITFMYTDRD